jgi:hypothetical protein
LISVFSVLGDGDLATESFYLGQGPGDSPISGLNRHSTVESDISPNREDFYLGCGNNHALSSRLVQQNIFYASQSDGFTLDAMGNHYAKSATFSQKNNPYLYFTPFPSIVALGAFVFYPNFMSNGTYGAGGVPNYESISSIIGADYDPNTGNFAYKPERFPDNWYRRATPYGVSQTLTDVLAHIYIKVGLQLP